MMKAVITLFLNFVNSLIRKVKNYFFKSNERSYVISIEGNIGSGKSTFLKYFVKFCHEKKINHKVINEPIDLWQNFEQSNINLLKLYYDDPVRWAFIFQSYVQLTLFEQIKDTLKCRSLIMTERSLFSSYFVFTNLLYTLNYIDTICFKILRKSFHLLTSLDYFKIDLIIYLQTKPEIAYERVSSRNRKGEKNIDFNYVKKLHVYYEHWLNSKHHYHPFKIITYDNNQTASDIDFNIWIYRILNELKSIE